jgi:hypothetical protein
LETRPSNHQIPIFLTGIILFAAAACFGWAKLHYGFNFIDEGYHATESWRLFAGDDFLRDKITGALTYYTLINSLIFEICPDITLLGFRKIQYLLTIFSLLIFSFALFKATGQYAWLPFIFSLFAFTGLDPIGMISNLYYQTYPHLFLTLYLSLLLFGLHAKNPIKKKILYLLSGFCLWGMSLSLLTLCVIILSPLFTSFLSRKFNFKYYSFTFKDLFYVVSPFLFAWIVFIIVFNRPYLLNILSSIDLVLSSSGPSSGLFYINGEVIKYVSISMAFLLLFFIAVTMLPIIFSLIGCTILSILIFSIIKTSFFGLLTPFYNGWFGQPMWFSSLLIAFIIWFWIYILLKYILKRGRNKEEELSIILMVPFTICACTMSLFSGLGSLSACQSAIPAVAAIAYMLTLHLKNMKYQPTAIIVTLILLLGPFYYTTARSDWDFTLFDVQPKQANVQINTGFGRGIYTNQIYVKVYDWLIANAKTFTHPDDYAISYIVSPMVHMITKLRPSLDDTFISFEKPLNYYEKCIEKMEQRGREPKIAFIFERCPMLQPVSLQKGTVNFPPKSFNFISSQDPISIYVKTHMIQASVFKISKDHIIRCYVDNNLPKNRKTGQSP